MKTQTSLTSVLKFLCRQHSVSGSERYYGFTKSVATLFKKTGLAVTTDSLGNVVASLGRGKFDVLLEAHGDEVGLMITKITPQAHWQFVSVGSLSPTALVNQAVVILSRRGEIPGRVIRRHRSPKISLADLAIKIKSTPPTKVSKLGIKPGDLVSFPRHFHLSPRGTITSPGLDNKVGVAALIRTAQLLKGKLPAGTKVTFVISTQHEQGNHRGIDAVMNQLQPDLAFVVDAAYAKPLTGSAEKTGHWSIPEIGRGPAIEPQGKGFCLNRFVLDFLTSTASESNIPYQFEIPENTAGGTDISAIYNKLSGIPTGVINIPVRYQHTPATVAHRQDIENGAQLIARLVQKGKTFIEQKWTI